MITAKVFLASMSSHDKDQTVLQFHADYNDGRNKEWSKYTPALGLTMTVLNEVAEKFEPSGKYTLTFSPSED